MSTMKKSDSDSTLMPTTDTMRKKAEFVSKCFVYLLKVLRCLKCTKGTKPDIKSDALKQTNVSPSERPP